MEILKVENLTKVYGKDSAKVVALYPFDKNLVYFLNPKMLGFRQHY